MRPCWTLVLLSGCTSPGAQPPADTSDTDAPFTPPPWQAPDAEGAYAAGFTTLEVEREGLPPLTVEVWYPAVPESGDEVDPYEAGGLFFPSEAWRDAPVAPHAAPWPVVAFSHGNGGFRFQSSFLTEHLARHGFVVVAPDHEGNTLTSYDTSRTAEAATRRPTDVAHAVDALDAPGVPGLAVDTARYVVSGHSLGAWTALAVGGGVLDLAGFESTCTTAPQRACAFFEDQAFVPADVARLAVPDPRAVATVALAPGAWYAFGANGGGLAAVHPVLVLGGTADGDLPFDTEIAPTFDRLGRPRWLGAFQRAGHWAFTELCGLVPAADCAGEAGGFLDPEIVQAETRTRALAFAGVHLLGDDRYAPWLEAGTDDLVWTVEP